MKTTDQIFPVALRLTSGLSRNNRAFPRSIFSNRLVLLAGWLVLFLSVISARVHAGGPAPVLIGEKAIAHLKETGQYESLSAAIANARYGVRLAEDSGRRAVAENPAQGMGIVFTPEGLSFMVATGGGTHTVRWQLKSMGFGKEQIAVPAGTLRTEGRQVELIRAGMKVTEWFRNAPAGLEHGFTLAERPSSNSAGEPLRLVLAVGGDLHPQADAAGQNLLLCDATGQTVLAYKKLKVWDAAGSELEAVMEVNNGNVVLSVGESGARYPLTIDPTFEAYIKASNAGSGDRFGNSVAISGDTVVVGAIAEASLNGTQGDNSQSGTGAVYVFVRSGGIWSQQAYLKATPLDANIAFGCSVAVSGDTLVAGAYGESRGATGVNGSSSYAGAAYVFVRSGTTWTQQAKLKASNIGADDRFAESVAISGDTIVVGSQHEDSAATGVNGDQTSEAAGDAGAAYVFVRSGTAWTQQAYLKASNTNANDRFGVSVGVSGDTIVVGANNEASAATGVNGNQSDNTAPGTGASYVFVRSGVTWSQQAYLKSSNNHLGYGFGNSVAISGDSIVAAARSENSAAGAAYVFVRSGTIWSEQARLAASNADSNDQFGHSVSISGDNIVIGAWQEASNATGINGDETNNSDSFAGAAYVFVRTGTAWSQQAYLKASNTDPGDFFGVGVGISGDTAVVGAYFEASGSSGINGNGTGNTATRSGAAYVYNLASVTDLSNLTLSAGTLMPAFASTTTTYGASVPSAIASMTVTPTVATIGATVKVNGVAVASGAASGAIALNIGLNIINVVVTSPDGNTTSTSTLTVSKAGLTNADLSDLTLTAGTLAPVFAIGTTAYTANVPNATTSTTVTPTVVDSTATVTVNGVAVASGSASGAIALNVGNNIISTLVTAQDGTTKKTYTVTVTRGAVQYTVTPGAGVNGSISPNTPQAVSSGASAAFTATPAVGYRVDQWVVNGTLAQTGGAGFTVNNVTADTTVQVTFKVGVPRDFNGDGNADLIFQNTVGQIAVWYMNGSGVATSTAYLYTGGLGDWRVVGIADFNSDGNADLVFQNTVGQIAVWYMNGSGVATSTAYLYTGGLGDWRVR